MSHKVFISYRRQDTQSEAILLQSDLEKIFGEKSCFLDISDIHIGDKWIKVLEKQGENAQICIVLIGKNWMEADQEGRSRLRDKNDWVRKAIEAAILQGLNIITVLVNGAKLPHKSDLPPKMHALLDHDAFEIRTNKWKTDIKDLAEDIKRILPAPNAPVYQHAVDLKLEADVKQNRINPQRISADQLQFNKRLRAAVLLK
jgi:hypothetical protein